MKYFIHLAYKGTGYHGWQRQPKHPSVQGVLENALERMLGKKTNCIGCGRTDAGVHASQFFCHIKTEKEFDFDPVFRLNKMLPDDVAIYGFIPVPKNAHAQRGAISRTYTYHIHTSKDPFLSEVSSFYPKENLETEIMEKAIRLLPSYPDYHSSCKQPHLYKSTICKISSASLQVDGDIEKLIFEITADRFLRGMVRIILGNVLEVGYGRMTLQEFENCLITGRPAKHFNMAYPQGLYLSEIVYPFLVL